MYYFLNIKDETGKRNADAWIKERHFAPFFYDGWTLKQLRDGSAGLTRGSNQIVKLFLNAFDGKSANNDAVVMSIGSGAIYLYKQKALLREYGRENNVCYNGFDVELIKECPIKDSPLIAASIKSNQRITMKTFSKLNSENHYGNCKALDFMLTGITPEVDSFEGYLRCLSSMAFETLIAKIFEEQGYFVPAYRGGTLSRYDLFCRKDAKTLALQVKTRLTKKVYEESEKENDRDIDYYYCVTGDEKTDKVRNCTDIEKQLKECPRTREWLSRNLHWIKYAGESL
jgi:hypothetical protein